MRFVSSDKMPGLGFISIKMPIHDITKHNKGSPSNLFTFLLSIPSSSSSHSLDCPYLPQTLRVCEYQNRTPFSGVNIIIMSLFPGSNAQLANLSNLPS